MLHSDEHGQDQGMSIWKSEIDDPHLVLHAALRTAAVIVLFVLIGLGVGLLWGWLSGELMYDHIWQGLMIGAGFGGITGVIVGFVSVPSRDESSDV